MPPPPRPLPRSLKPVPARVHETHSEQTISGLSVVTPSTPATLPRPIHRQATWVRPRAPLPPQRVHSRRQMDDHLRQACCERWGQILPRLGQHSNLAIAFAKSERPEDFLSLSLRKFTPSTLQTYFRHIGTFVDYLGTMGGDLESMTLQLPFLLQCRPKQTVLAPCQRLSPGSSGMPKYLHWRLSYRTPWCLPSTHPRAVDRREAIPIPLAVIASWERCVCHDSAPDALRLFLGGLLLAAHASLRFGDLQRIEVTRLCLTSSALRGLCWATKTTRQGQPFAVTVMGFTGRDISTSWVVHWLRALAQSLARTQREFGSEHCPDYWPAPSTTPHSPTARR